MPVRLTVIPFISRYCGGPEVIRQSLCLRNIVPLPRSQNEFQRIAEGVGGDTDFGAESAPAGARSLFILTAVLFQRTGGARVSTDHCAAGDQEFRVRIPGAEGEKPFSYASDAPPSKSPVNAVPQSVFLRKKPPLTAAPCNPQYRSDEKQAGGFISGINIRIIFKKIRNLIFLIISQGNSLHISSCVFFSGNYIRLLSKCQQNLKPPRRKYIKNYRKMLKNPDTVSSKMRDYIKEKGRTTWKDIKNTLINQNGYTENSGSFAASLRVLEIEGYIEIHGRGDDKMIRYIR